MEAKMKFLEMIQGVTSKMERNSFLFKGWTLALVSAVLAGTSQTRLERCDNEF